MQHIRFFILLPIYASINFHVFFLNFFCPNFWPNFSSFNFFPSPIMLNFYIFQWNFNFPMLCYHVWFSFKIHWILALKRFIEHVQVHSFLVSCSDVSFRDLLYLTRMLQLLLQAVLWLFQAYKDFCLFYGKWIIPLASYTRAYNCYQYFGHIFNINFK